MEKETSPTGPVAKLGPDIDASTGPSEDGAKSREDTSRNSYVVSLLVLGSLPPNSASLTVASVISCTMTR